MSMLQALVESRGGAREKQAPIARIELDEGADNVAWAYAEDGTVLFQFGWRPFETSAESPHGLFFCG